jgi:hypothetical protein
MLRPTRNNVRANGAAARKRRRWPLGVAIVVLVFCAVTARLFIWPATGMPAHVDAIVMLAGPGDRLTAATQLAREHRANILVVSRGNDGYGGPCPPSLPGVRLICFDPDPATTQGEAEFVGRLARRFGWKSLVLITSTPQASRARLRMERCFRGEVFVLTAGLPLSSLPGEIAYEWGATIKMLVWQRSC